MARSWSETRAGQSGATARSSGESSAGRRTTSVTPGRMLGRMTSTMRWLILLPAGPGALWGGWLGEHYGLRAPLGFAGITGLLLALTGWRLPVIRSVTTLPTFKAEALAPFSSDRAG